MEWRRNNRSRLQGNLERILEMDTKEAIEKLDMLTAWDKTFWQVIKNWPELECLIYSAQELGEDDTPDTVTPAFPNEFNYFTNALTRLLRSFEWRFR